MGSAYTPGLKVSPHTSINKLRRLPLKGFVLVKVGDSVTPDTIVARTELPGMLQSVKVADRLGVEPDETPGLMKVQIGDSIEKGDLIAETKGIFGRFFRTEVRSKTSGKVEFLSPATGNLGIREAPIPVERNAYIRGVISEVIPEEGVVVQCEGAFIQGIFGVGGERLGEIAIAKSAPENPLTAEDLDESHRGKIVVGGVKVTLEALRKALDVGIVGIVCGGVVDRDLMDFLAEALNSPGYDIGVAITGQEAIPFSLMLTEGFGSIHMAERTFNLFKSLEGQLASLNGATQIRAGVIRPEVIVPFNADSTSGASLKDTPSDSGQLRVGTSIRIIREPYFGLLGAVSSLPAELTQIESETWVRVLEAKLLDGRRVLVPRANVEIIETD